MSEPYFKCGGCGRFVLYSMQDKHYDSGHTEGIAVESPPAPATVANPPPQPKIGHDYIPPRIPEPKLGWAFNILVMRRNFPRAFIAWTIIVFCLTSLFISNLFLWLVFHI